MSSDQKANVTMPKSESENKAPNQGADRDQQNLRVFLDGADIQTRINVLLEEYKTLRTESLQGIQARHQVVTFAFGALSVIIAGILSSSTSALLLGFVAYFAVPQIAKSALLMWLGEYRRSARAGQRLRTIEGQINRLAGQDLLSWEVGLSSGRSHMSYPYAATVFVVLLVSYLSLAIGIAQFSMYVLANPVPNLRPTRSVWVVATSLTLFAATVEVLFWWWFSRLWNEARQSTT